MTAPEHLDVLIVGAGLSGIGAACHLERDRPGTSYAVLESRGATGGTWDLFRYPGVRSDSDLHSFGYAFRPWTAERSIATGPEVLEYLRATAAEYGVDRRVRLHHRVGRAEWSTAEARWAVDVERTDTGQRVRLTCGWLFTACGYYRYDRGHTPAFDGTGRFAGRVVHPQHWPDDLDHAGLRVAVVGSGATAVTVVPALAETAAHVTMVQRTPSYVLPLPSVDPVARAVRRVLPGPRAHAFLRWKAVAEERAIYRLSRRFPRAARRALRWAAARRLPEGYPVGEHFDPPYEPWDQRLCVAADGDLFRSIREGRASVVTDHVEAFTERGLRLRSGREVEADVVVTATGLELVPFGGIELAVDGADVDVPSTVMYKGLMLSGVPNFSAAVGYTAAAWTLKVGLVLEHWCRLLAHMDAHGHASCRPVLPDRPMATRPVFDFGAGYVQRSVGALPLQGDRAPWVMPADYRADARALRRGPVDGPDLRFSPWPTWPSGDGADREAVLARGAASAGRR